MLRPFHALVLPCRKSKKRDLRYALQPLPFNLYPLPLPPTPDPWSPPFSSASSSTLSASLTDAPGSEIFSSKATKAESMRVTHESRRGAYIWKPWSPPERCFESARSRDSTWQVSCPRWLNRSRKSWRRTSIIWARLSVSVESTKPPPQFDQFSTAFRTLPS